MPLGRGMVRSVLNELALSSGVENWQVADPVYFPLADIDRATDRQAAESMLAPARDDCKTHFFQDGELSMKTVRFTQVQIPGTFEGGGDFPTSKERGIQISIQECGAEFGSLFILRHESHLNDFLTRLPTLNLGTTKGQRRCNVVE